jgi:DNA-binding SARP family transcriptional activator/tetratricopeptide (TPR) repeat protein
MVKYAILGPIELFDGERRLRVGGPRQVALLAFLLVHANRAVSSERAIDALWGEEHPARALKSLQVTISRLRKALDIDHGGEEPALRTVAGGYLLAVRPGELDSDVFQARAEDGLRALEAGEAARARDVLREALEMWRGPVLADVAHEQFAQPEIRWLEELRLAALEASVDARQRLGDHGSVIAELQALIAAYPGRERLAAQLMLALYRCGRQGDALEVYTRTRAHLSDELGLEPGPALQALQADILAQSPTLQRPAEEPRAAATASASATALVTLALPRSLRPPTGSPFVGRDVELARLRERWTQVCSGTRSAVVIGGEPGIGKTRLAAELARVVHDQGALVLYGRCDEGLAVPYQPFVEALRPYARAVGVDRLRAQLSDLAPELGRLLPEFAGLGEPLRGDPESERFALFEAVAALIEAITRQQPALLVLDDLHWAARPTLLLLRHLVRSERPLSVLVLGSYRETEPDCGDGLTRLLADLHRDASTEHLSIRGLDEPAIAVLLKATIGHPRDKRVSRLVQQLRAQTAGNPFFLRELLAHLAESDETSISGATAAPLDIPDEVRQVISHRVARLSAPAGRALSVAAVAGPSFSFVLLERVLGDRSGVLDALEEAVAAGLLTDAEHGDYVFAHALVRQTIYEQLGSARRMRLHHQLGETLEALVDAETHLEELAHHFAEAAGDGQAVKAADYALAAGRSATARLGHEEAVAHYERGLEALGLAGSPQKQRRCELLLALGLARWSVGALDKARQAYLQAAELAHELGDRAALARAALGFCGPHRFEATTAVTQPIVGLLERALGALGHDDGALRAQLMSRLAIYTDVEQRKSLLARQALAMAREVADEVTLADVLASTLWATRGPDATRESTALAAELGRVADHVGDRPLRALAYRWLLEHLLELADIDGAEREFEALQQLAATRSERHIKWLVAVFRATRAYLSGSISDCEALAHEALSHRYEGHDDDSAQGFGSLMLFVRREQGRLDELLETVERFARDNPQLAGWRCGLALIHAQLGHTALARQEVEALAHAGFCDIPRDAYWLTSLSGLSEVVFLLGDASRAQQLYELLSPYAERCVVLFGFLCQGSVSHPLGLLATALARYDDAARHFEHALTMNARIRSPRLIAHTQHEYAHMLLQRDQPGDRAKALRLLEQALATADQLGLKALADKARPLEIAGETAAPCSTSPAKPGG